MATFQKVKLGAVVDLQQGLCINRKSRHLLVEKSDLPLLRITDLINDKQEQYIDTNAVSSQFIADEKTLIYTRTGQVGLVFRNRKGVVHNNCFKILPKQNLDINFLFYSLKQNGFYKNMVRIASKAAQPDLTHTAFKSAEIDIPKDLPTQTRIASVFSAYDDLIENNEKRIKALEEMAQLLYTEWFVKFKFPGHEKVKMVESRTEYGMVPEGYEVKRLGEIGMVITGKTPPTGNLDNFNGEVLFIKTPDIHGNIFILETEQTLSEIGTNTQSLKLLPEKTIFVSCIGTLGVVGITSRPSQTNQQINSIILNDKTDYIFFYFFAKDLKQQLIGLGSNGATMGNVNKSKFENIKILYPKDEVRKKFFNATVNIFDEILSLQKKNKTLSKTRDLLIPQLVTGKRELNFLIHA